VCSKLVVTARPSHPLQLSDFMKLQSRELLFPVKYDTEKTKSFLNLEQQLLY